MIAVGGSAVAAEGFLATGFFAAGAAVCDMSCREEKAIRRISTLRMVAPGMDWRRDRNSIVRQGKANHRGHRVSQRKTQRVTISARRLQHECTSRASGQCRSRSWEM